MPPARFANPLEASSYHHPNGGAAYAPLREQVIKTATAMGYDPATMTEHGVVWADDQDPFGHVMGAAYPHYFAVCNFRIFESFETQLKEKYDDLLKARGIGVITKTYTVDLMRPVTYPDSLIVANRLTEVLPDRYYGITSIWSLKQQAIVAENRGYVVFFDYSKGKPANLIEAGGVYADLHVALTKRVADANELAAKWEKEHPKRPRKKQGKL